VWLGLWIEGFDGMEGEMEGKMGFEWRFREIHLESVISLINKA